MQNIHLVLIKQTYLKDGDLLTFYLKFWVLCKRWIFNPYIYIVDLIGLKIKRK